jgi:6-phosphogluconolactonase (cycloisomerase 2 family)
MIASFLMAVSLSGCGKFFAKVTTTTTTTGTGDYLYVANANTSLDTIAGFSLAGGALSATASSPYQLTSVPSTLAITPSNSILFVGSELGGVYAYLVGSKGGLTLSGTGAVASVSATSLAVDSTGNWLLALQSAGTAPLLTVFAIDTTTGALTTQGSLSLNTGTSGSLYFLPGTTFLYATLGTGGVEGLSFDSTTGVVSTLSVLINPRGTAYADQRLAGDPTGKFLFVTETGTNGVRSFSIDANGVPTEVAGSPVATGLGVGAVRVDSTGTFLYAANSAANTISAFTIGTTGALTAIAGSPFPTGSSPSDMAEDHSKGYLAVVCSGGTPDLELFPIATTGVLGTAISQSTGGAVSPAGAYALVASH